MSLFLVVSRCSCSFGRLCCSCYSRCSRWLLRLFNLFSLFRCFLVLRVWRCLGRVRGVMGFKLDSFLQGVLDVSKFLSMSGCCLRLFGMSRAFK